MGWKLNQNWLELRDKLDIPENKISKIVEEFESLNLWKPSKNYTAMEKVLFNTPNAGDLISTHIAKKYRLSAKQSGRVTNFFHAKSGYQFKVLRQEAVGITHGKWRDAQAGRYPCPHAEHDNQIFALRKGIKHDGTWIFPGESAGCMCGHTSVIPGLDDSPKKRSFQDRLLGRNK